MNYRSRISAVTGDDVVRVARQYLKPEQIVILITGDVTTISMPDPEKSEFSLDQLSTGPITALPLPDPFTMEYPTGNLPRPE